MDAGICIIMCLWMVGLLLLCNGLTIIGIIFTGLAIWATYYRIRVNSVSKKKISEMTDREKKFELRQIESYYKAGKLSYVEYDGLKRLYSGGSALPSGMNMSEYMALGNAIDADCAYNRQVENAQRNIAYSSGIGAGLGGLGGQIYAGGSTAIDEMAKTAAAAQNRDLAHQKLEEEMRKRY